MNISEYKVPPYEEDTHRVVQWLVGKRHPMQVAVSVWGDIACDSCDAILATEGATIKIGDRCRQCASPVIGFLPLPWREECFLVEHDEGYSADEAILIRALGETLLVKDPENKLQVNVSKMNLSLDELVRYGITGKYRLLIGMHAKKQTLEIEELARSIWEDVETRVWSSKLGTDEASGFGILVALHYPSTTGAKVTV